MLKERGKIIKRFVLFWEWAKGKGEFRIKEAKAIFGNTVKILISQLTQQGFLERQGWGKYRVKFEQNRR